MFELLVQMSLWAVLLCSNRIPWYKPFLIIEHEMGFWHGIFSFVPSFQNMFRAGFNTGKIISANKTQSCYPSVGWGHGPELAPQGCAWGSDLAAAVAAIPQPPTSLFDCLFSLKHMFPIPTSLWATVSIVSPFWLTVRWQPVNHLARISWICFKEGLAAR